MPILLRMGINALMRILIKAILFSMLLCISSQAGIAPLKVCEEDGSPCAIATCAYVTNGSLSFVGTTAHIVTGGASVPGSDAQVIFNDGGAFGADPGMTYNKTTDSIVLVGTVAAGTVTGANITSGSNPGHTHTGTSLSGIDVSDDTNLAGDTEVVLTGDALSLAPGMTRDTEWDTCSEINTATSDGDFVLTTRALTLSGTSNEISSSAGAQDLSADRTWTLSLPAAIVLTSKLLMLPNGTAPVSTDCDAAGEAGRIFIDTDATSGQQIYVCEGVSGWKLEGDGTGSGEANTASNLGNGLASYDSKSGVDLRFNSFAAADFDLALNLITIDAAVTKDAEWDTEGEVQTAWGSVNVILATEIDTSSELSGIVTDETGSGKLAFATSPVFLTGVTFGDASSATFTLNSDLSGASDPTIQFGNNMITISHDLTVTGDDLFMATNTSGAILVADGTNFNPVVMSSDATIGTDGSLTIAANAIALGADTVNNYVATIADSGNSTVTVSGSGSENAAVTLNVVDLNCTDCINTTEITDVYLLNSGDTITGDLVYSDGSNDSPKATFTPQTGTAWDLYTVDSDDDFQIISTSSSTETVEITNTGTGVADLTVEGTVAGGTITGINVTSGANPGHTHTGASLSGVDISDDTNLAGDSEAVLTGDSLSLASGITRDTEWDTEGEVQTAWGGANIIVATEIDTSSEFLAIVNDETGSGLLAFATSPNFTTSLSVNAGDAADSGDIRLLNGASIAWEASPAGTDQTLSVDSSEILQYNGTINGTTITGANVTSGANPGHTHTGTSLSGVDISDDTNLAGDSEVVLTGDALSLASVMTRDTEWDTEGEVQTAWGSVNIILATEIDTSSELKAILTDETGSGGAAVFATAPTITGEVLAAGTSSVAPLTLTSGTNLTTAAAGALEYDGNVFYSSPKASQRGVSPSIIFAANTADLTGANNANSQPIFNTAYDTLTVAASTTYYFELFLSVTNGATTCTKALDLNDGTATFTAIRYSAISQNTAVNTTGITLSGIHIDTAASTIILATGTTSWWIKANGIIRFNGAGTFIPKFAFSANPTGTVLIKRESYIILIPLGTDAVASVGQWS